MRPILPILLLLAVPAFASEPMDHSKMDHSSMQMEMTPAPTSATPTQLVPEIQSDMPPMEMSGHDMVPLTTNGLIPAATDRVGGEALTGDVKDGVREFHLSASQIAWPINDHVTVAAYAYNGQVPGPALHVKQGEKIRVVFTNNLPEPSTIHWHGVDVPIEMDGVPGVSQDAVPPGGSFTYEFTVTNAPGTYFYHSHVMPDRQQALGLSGAFIVDAPESVTEPVASQDHTLVLGEWTVKDGGNIPSMPMEGMFPNYFTINGKEWPATPHIRAKVGEKILFRLIGAGAFSHPIHLHGAPFTVVATDGHPVPPAAQLTKDTLLVSPGERYDILWAATRPGTWMLHCHINHHTMGDAKSSDGMGGMVIAIDVTP